MPKKIVNKEKKDSLERIDVSIGIYAITGFSLLVYIFWISLEDVFELAYITLIIDLVWFNYSRRLLRLNNDSDYTKNYTINYMICVFVCFAMYIIDMPMLYRNIFIFLASCEGFIRTFFLEIRRLINKSKDIESKYLQNK